MCAGAGTGAAAAGKQKFCEALANGASPTKAAKAIEVARSTVYYQRGIDPEFKEAWADALERAADHPMSPTTLFQLARVNPQVNRRAESTVTTPWSLSATTKSSWQSSIDVTNGRSCTTTLSLDPSPSPVTFACNAIASLTVKS